MNPSMNRLVFAALLAACGATPTPIARRPTQPVRALVATGDWTTSATEPYRGKQDDLYFVSPTIGFYGNGAGKIFRTDDAGATWKLVFERTGTYVRALGFLDADHGFAGNIGPDSFPGVTDEVLLYRTDDGGASWQPVSLPDAAGARGVCAIDVLTIDAVNAGQRLRKQHVFVGGRVNGPAALFASDDGGASWKRLALPPEVAMILDVKFLDSSTGFVFAGSDPDSAKSHGVIAKTTDSGRNWRIVYRSTRPHELMWKGSCPSRRTCYATLQNYSVQAEDHPIASRYVVKTEDGGDSWREIRLVEDPAVQQFGVAFVDVDHGWVGAVPTGFETRDGGSSWRVAPAMPRATNKLRVVRDGERARVWAIGTDIRWLDLIPEPSTGSVRNAR